MSDDFAFDDFDDEPLSGAPPKKAAPSPPVRPPQSPAAPAPPAAPKAAAPRPPVAPAVKEEPVFDFEDDFDAESSPPQKAAGKKQKPPKAPGAGRSPRSTLLLVLLLLVAGAGYYFLAYLPGQEPPAPAPVAQQPVAKPVPPPPGAQAVPPKPAQTAAQSQAASAAPAQTAVTPPPAPKPAAPVASPAAASKPTAATTAAQPVPPPPAATKPAPGATAASASPPVAAPAKPALAKTAPAVVAKEPPSPALSGKFQLRCGPFALRENLLSAEKKVRQIGYDPRVSTVKRPIAMTRLRVGSYLPQEAEARRAELAARYPGVFLVAQEEQRVLYAGSFQNLDEARRMADRLYRDGIRTEEETAKVSVPLKLVSFGDFADRSAAEQAAGMARSAGLEVEIAGRR